MAGPNGSGKSTVIDENLNTLPDILICPDEIVKLKEFKRISNIRERYIAAMEKAKELRKIAIDNGLSLAFETVFSTNEKLEFLKYAKVKDYYVEVIFVTTRDPYINVDRVNQRVESGGHSVPKEKIIERYQKSMNLIADIVKVAHTVKVYDNSEETPFIVFFKNYDRKIVLLNKSRRDNWVDKYIINPLIECGVLDNRPRDLDIKETNDYINNSCFVKVIMS
nr:zeta toxin family protein [Desulfofarcimen acetoxidans]